jgi:transcriptional regulator with XRE-family HTH domain
MNADPRYLRFGKAVAYRRDQLKMTQAELAARVGLSRASIANIERGRQSVLLHHACDLAAALSVSRLDDLLPAQLRSTLEDQSLALSEHVSSDAKAQIEDVIASAIAVAKVRSS